MKKGSLIQWGQSQEKSLSLLKDMLSKAPILQYPDFTKEFSVETDTSQVGLGAVLTQVYEIEGKQRSLPVVYASRSLKGAERKYSVTDQEALAVVWAVKTFNLYIMGTHFTIITNHNALNISQKNLFWKAG